jgi:HEAT repeat protein
MKWIFAATSFLAVLAAFASPARPASSVPAVSPAAPALQAPYDQVVRELRSRDRSIRLQAVRLLKEAAYPEAATPLATVVTDPDDEVQLEAIAAEVNIFSIAKIAGRKRVGMVIEVRNANPAETVFAVGPLAIGPRPVPDAVLVALRAAASDVNGRVGAQALYAFGTLAVEPSGVRRAGLLRETIADFTPLMGVSRRERRLALLRVVGRVFDHRPDDAPIDAAFGDVIITTLNDNDFEIRAAAAEALGAMRYERAIDALSQQFQYFGRGEVAEAALQALARIAHPSTAPILVPQLASKNEAFRAIAIEGLARIGDRAQRDAIESAAVSATDDRGKLAGAYAGVMISESTIDPLIEALRKPRVQAQARRYLVELARGRVSGFTRHVQDPDPQIRAGVADVLALAGDVEGLPIVTGLLSDRDERVVVSAERAVARLRSLK